MDNREGDASSRCRSRPGVLQQLRSLGTFLSDVCAVYAFTLRKDGLQAWAAECRAAHSQPQPNAGYRGGRDLAQSTCTLPSTHDDATHDDAA